MAADSAGLSLPLVRRLLSPRTLALKNAVTRGERRGLYLSFAVLALFFWAGLFAGMLYLVDQFWEVGAVGPVLARKFLDILLASLFSLLAFSNIITALSVFYLSDDLELLLALPVSRSTFHYARYVDTLVQSSWMMLLFGFPVFSAAGVIANAGPAYYFTVVFAVPCIMVIATSIGVIVATFLVNVFPARRTREFMVFVGVLMVAAAFVLLRALRPEQLADAQAFASLSEYLAALELPFPVLFPPRWAGEVIGAPLLHSPIPWVPTALLISGALASLALARWATARGFDGGWALAQEARAARFYRSRIFDHLVAVLPRTWRPIAAKELRVLVRDPSQWSQVFLLIGLCAIYLVSVKALPVGAFRGEGAQLLREGITFLNLGMAGFVMAAIAARFQFTAISREGKSWWVLRGAPVDPLVVLRAKAAFGLPPMIIVGEVVVVGSGLLLGARPGVLVAEGVLTLFMAWGISGIATALGAIWPDFTAENAARAASSPAAVFFMVIAQVLVAVILAFFVLAAYLAFKDRWIIAAILASVPLALCVFSGEWPTRRAAAILWARGLN